MAISETQYSLVEGEVLLGVAMQNLHTATLCIQDVDVRSKLLSLITNLSEIQVEHNKSVNPLLNGEE